MNKATLRALRENYEVASPGLKAKIDAECERVASAAGRKPFSAAKLRSRKIQVSLNEGEFARILNAVGTDAEVAAAVRELALKAADEIVRRRESGEF